MKMKGATFRHAWIITLLMLLTVRFTADPASALGTSPSIPDSYAQCGGLCIIDLLTGEPVVEINPDRLFIPASVTKALTSASVMCLKDSSERFVTPITAVGKISDGVLEGNILITCMGDPTIESRHFAEACGFADSIAQAAKRMGISCIKGRVIVDESAMPDCTVPPGWMSEDLTEPYGAQLFAANFANNCVTLTMPGCRFNPATPALEVLYERSKRKPHLYRRRDEQCIRISGTVSPKGFSRKIANPLPASTMAESVSNALSGHGIEITGDSINPGGPAELLYTHFSPRYVDIMRSLMFRSDNLFAEGMLRTLAMGECRADALAEQADIWRDNDVEEIDRVVIEDGSGLSRANRMTPRFLARVLKWMSQSLTAQSYIRLFPRAGSEGTVRGFLAGTSLAGRMVLKSGSMRGVQSYAGYLLGEDGIPTHAVVLMANDFKCSRPTLKHTMTDILLEIFEPEAPVPDPECEADVEIFD